MTRAGARGLALAVATIAPIALGLAGCGPLVIWFGRDPSRTTLVEVMETRAGQRVEVDRRPGPWFDAIGFAALAFTADGHVAYPARRGEGWHVVHDGTLGPRYDGVGDVRLSADGAHVVYSAERAGRWFVVHDARAYGPYDELVAGSLRITETGDHVAFVAREGGDYTLVRDGHHEGPYEAVGELQMVGARWAYFAVTDAGAVTVLDGVAMAPVDAVRELHLSERAATWIAFDDEGAALLRDGRELARARSLRALEVAPSGRWWVIAERAEGEELLEEGRVVGAAPRIPLALPPAGTRPAVWIGVSDVGWVVHADGYVSPPFERVDDLVAAGAHYAFVGHPRGGRERARDVVVLDGRVAARADAAHSVTITEAGGLAFATGAGEGARVHYAGGEFSAPGLVAGSVVLSPDGDHVACLLMTDDGLVVLVDGARRIVFDHEELACHAMRRESAEALGDLTMLRRWVAGELLHALSAMVEDHE